MLLYGGHVARGDPALKDWIDGLKAIRDQAKADAERGQAMLDSAGSKAITRQMIRVFAKTARQRIRLEGGGYRRDHLRALAQRVEVAEGEVRIIGSKSRLLQTLAAKPGVNAVPIQGLSWRSGSVPDVGVEALYSQSLKALEFSCPSELSRIGRQK